MKTEKEIVSYLETYYEVVCILEDALRQHGEESKINKYYLQYGMGGMWELAKETTDDFEFINRNENWEGCEWLETLNDYVYRKIDQL